MSAEPEVFDLAEKNACFCSGGLFDFTDLSVSLLTIPKAFLAVFSKGGGISKVCLDVTLKFEVSQVRL